MSEQRNSTSTATPSPLPNGQVVSIMVANDHPLLQLKRALNWEAIKAVMIKQWRKAGRNIDGGPGLPWPVEVYVPLLVLMSVKTLDSRQMEHHLEENVVARLGDFWQRCYLHLAHPIRLSLISQLTQSVEALC
jgi:hypothetical protein